MYVCMYVLLASASTVERLLFIFDNKELVYHIQVDPKTRNVGLSQMVTEIWLNFNNLQADSP
jgi:hypothetical protein